MAVRLFLFCFRARRGGCFVDRIGGLERAVTESTVQGRPWYERAASSVFGRGRRREVLELVLLVWPVVRGGFNGACYAIRQGG